MSAQPTHSPSRILIPVDVAEPAEAQRALAYAIDLLPPHAGTITFIHVIDLTDVALATSIDSALGAESWSDLAARSTGVLNELGIDARAAGVARVNMRVEHGTPADIVIEAASEHDLVLMSQRQNRGMLGWLSKTIPEQVARLSATPVLTLPQDEDLSTRRAPSLAALRASLSV